MKILKTSTQWKVAHYIVAMYITAKNGLNYKLEQDEISLSDWEKEIDNLIEYTQTSLIALVGLDGMNEISLKYQLTL